MCQSRSSYISSIEMRLHVICQFDSLMHDIYEFFLSMIKLHGKTHKYESKAFCQWRELLVLAVNSVVKL